MYGYAQNVHIDHLLLHAYQYVPFTNVFGIVTAAPILLCCLCCNCERQEKKCTNAREKEQGTSEEHEELGENYEHGTGDGHRKHATDEE